MIRNNLFKLFFVLIVVLGLLSFMRSNAPAAVTGKIAGTIVDSQTKEPLPGVNVTIEGTTLGAATLPNGEYFVIGIPPGIYMVTASLIGYQKMSVSDVNVNVDRTTTVNFSVKSTTIESKEAVIVTAERPTIIRDLTASSTRTDATVFQSTPVQDTRDLINLNAGILRDQDGNILIRGGAANQFKFYVDGLSIEENDTRENGMRDVMRNLTNKFQFNVLGVQEMEVITGGFNAEYGDAQSGIINIVTKEGGGAFHGEFRVEYGPKGKYHFGNYEYDPNQQLAILEWKDFSAWETWNNGRTNPKEYKDSLAGWYEKWKLIVMPSNDKVHMGGAYDYRELTYKRAVWGVGGPLRGNKVTFFFSGELRSKPSLYASPFKYFNYDNLDFNLTYRITPKMKLKLKAYSNYNQDGWRGFSENNIHDAIGVYSWGAGIWTRFAAYKEKFDLAESATFTHTLTPTTYYEVMVTHMRNERKSTEADAGYPDSKNWWIPQIPPVSRYVYLGSNYSENNGEARQHNYRARVDVTSQIDAHNQMRVGVEGRTIEGYTYSGHTNTNFSDATWNASAYHLTPHYFAGYVQDKMEYGGMVANLGVRFDYYDANKDAPYDIYNPLYVLGGSVRGNPNTVPNKTFLKPSPRFGFSHPISENTAFHFQYGHFYQSPAIEMIDNYGLYSGGYQFYPNPNLGPAKTVSYEFGVQHNIRGTHRINMVVYFNDLTEQHGTRRMQFPLVGNSTDRNFTQWFDNIGYGTSKGVELTLDRTSIGKWYYRFSYTLARVFTGSQGTSEQWSSDPLDARNWTRRMDARSFLRGADRTHRITGILSFRSPRDWGRVWGEWDLSMNIMIQSGTPFTYYTTYDESLTLVNNRRRPYEESTDLYVKKWIQMGRIRPQVFVRVTNLFNNMWMRNAGRTDMERWLQYNSINSDKNSPQYPSNNFTWYYNEARRMYLGVGFDF